MGILDDAIREHLELKRRQGASSNELDRLEGEAFGPPSRPGEPDFPEPSNGEQAPEQPTTLLSDEPAGEPSEGAIAEPEPAVAAVEPPELAEPELEPPLEEPAAEAPPPAGAIPFDLESDSALDPSLAEPEPLAEPAGEPVDEPATSFDDPRFETGESLGVELDSTLAPEQEEGFDDIELEASESLDPLTDEGPPPPVETTEHSVAEPGAEEAPGALEEPLAEPAAEDEDDEDVLEETPDFLREQPEDDELWFEQGEPKDFDFDD